MEIPEHSDSIHYGRIRIFSPLKHWVETHFKERFSENWQEEIPHIEHRIKNGQIKWDLLSLLKTINRLWDECFEKIFTTKTHHSQIEHTDIKELIDIRNKHSHDEPFSFAEADHALDTMYRLMKAIGKDKIASELEKLRNKLKKENINISPIHTLADVKTDKRTNRRGEEIRCTYLYFEKGVNPRCMDEWADKDGEITKKAKNLIGKPVITIVWNPKDGSRKFSPLRWWRDIEDASDFNEDTS